MGDAVEGGDAGQVQSFGARAPAVAGGTTMWLGWWAAAAFPVVLWALSACYYGGDIGKWADDYSNSVRDPATGEYTFADIVKSARRYGPFYRRGSQFLVVSKATLLWDYDWLNHLLNAVTHGLVALLVWHFLRRFTRSGLPAAAGALLFLLFPLSAEVVLYSSGQIYHFATAAGLLLMLVYMRYAEGRWGWGALILTAVLTYAITLWQEQPATGIVVFPLLYLAVCRPEEPWRRRVVRGLLPILVAGLVCALYIALIASTVPTGRRGSAQAYAASAQYPERLGQVTAGIASGLYGLRSRHVLVGGFAHGWETLANPVGLTWVVVLAIAVGVWWLYWSGRSLVVPAAAPAPSWRARLLLIAFGFGLFVMAWAPVVVMKIQIVEARMYYYPLIGLLLAGAVVLDWIAAGLARGRAAAVLFRATLGAVVAWLAVYGGVCFVGYQALYREEARLDQLEMAQLQELVPDPAPNSVFVPLRTENKPAHTGYVLFDHFAPGALAMPWAAKAIVRQTYRRSDVSATHFNPWVPLQLRDFDEESAGYWSTRVSWANMIPFVVDEQSKVHLVSEVLIERGGNNDLRISFEQAQAALRRHGLPERVFAIQDSGPAAQLEPLSEWKWVATGEPAQFEPHLHWHASNLSVEVHPPYAGDPDHGALVATLAPSSQPQRLHFRVTVAEWMLKDRELGDGVEFAWYLDGQKDAPLATLALRPSQIVAEQRWLPVSMELPPLARPRELYLEVGPGPAGDTEFDGCLVSVGYREVVDAPRGE